MDCIFVRNNIRRIELEKENGVINHWKIEYYKGSNLIGYRVPGGFWVDFFHKKLLIQP